MHSRSRSCAFLVLFVFSLSGCGSSGGDFNLISLEEEWRLGQQLAADIERQMPMVRDAEALRYVQSVGSSLVSQTDMGRLPWQFHVVQDSEVNAFNIPGGHVYITTGLIASADQAAEFAGVMAHEISHGVERHATEQLTKAYGLEIIAGVVLGGNAPAYQQILAQIVGTGTLAKFSRQAEEEADRLGVRLMAGAGYDPRGMVTMFEQLLRDRERKPGSVARFFATHPLTESRIRTVTEEIQKVTVRTGAVMDDPQYQSIRRRLGS